MSHKQPTDLRREYVSRPFLNPNANPFVQFQSWFDEAKTSEIIEPNACALATAGKDLKPSVRMVLLKGVDEKGFVIFTNYQSRKGVELAENPNAALLFYWDVLERQVRLCGGVEKISRADSEEYFRKRPRGAQISAFISQQSQKLNSRAELEALFQKTEEKFANGEIPLPDSWGGYRITPTEFEFWQGQENRLHQRYQYAKSATDGSWKLSELSP